MDNWLRVYVENGRKPKIYHFYGSIAELEELFNLMDYIPLNQVLLFGEKQIYVNKNYIISYEEVIIK